MGDFLNTITKTEKPSQIEEEILIRTIESFAKLQKRSQIKISPENV